MKDCLERIESSQLGTTVNSMCNMIRTVPVFRNQGPQQFLTNL